MAVSSGGAASRRLWGKAARIAICPGGRAYPV
jgi:hypothetical protein